ncbi:MAG: DUF4389 domain-containing protein [Chloroflexi bacterium]|nr:DUF4389 domain-containing protein [Chloroflexota bacterium]
MAEGAERPATPQMKESETSQQGEESSTPTPPQDVSLPQKVAVHTLVSALGERATHPRYPVRLEIDYPERQSRWTALLRLPLSIPLFIFLYLLSNAVDVAIIAAILVRGRIPRWLFEFRVAASRWIYRAGAYVLLLTDEYAPFEGDHAVSYYVTYPQKLSRWKLLVWKFITSVPHFVVVFFLALTLIVVVPIGWFAILLTGRFPRGLHGYVTGVLRWVARVSAYAFSLTDEFPPFSLSADAGSGSNTTYVFSSAVGVLAVGAVFAGIAALAIFRPGDVVAEVSYERLLAGEVSSAETRVRVDSAEDIFESAQTGTVELTAAADPADELVPLLVPQTGYRFVQFELVIENESYDAIESDQSSFSLKGQDGHSRHPVLAVVDGRTRLWEVDEGESALVVLLFELPEGIDPAELRFTMGHHVHRTVIYEFR